MYRKITAFLLVVMAVLLGGLSMARAESQAVNLVTTEATGTYLVDAKGMTLYFFTKDTPGQSACTGECLVKWPPLQAEAVTVGQGLEGKDFGRLARDGAKQVTYRGYPLYYFFKDEQAGDRKGQGVNNVWYVIDPATFPPTK